MNFENIFIRYLLHCHVPGKQSLFGHLGFEKCKFYIICFLRLLNVFFEILKSFQNFDLSLYFERKHFHQT